MTTDPRDYLPTVALTCTSNATTGALDALLPNDFSVELIDTDLRGTTYVVRVWSPEGQIVAHVDIATPDEAVALIDDALDA